MKVCGCLLLFLIVFTARAERSLNAGWTLESGCVVHENGSVVSSAHHREEQPYHIDLPSTVLAAQVTTGKYPDPYFGTNLRDIPGMSYPVGDNFSNLPMPEDSPYRCSWWYRKSFSLPVADRAHHLALHFDGINYRANVWLNGKQVADEKQIAGAYRTYDLDISRLAHAGGDNVLAVEVFAPTETDLGINWVDWNPCPPDKDMGLTGGVSLKTSGAVTVDAPVVTTHFADASLQEASLQIAADITNVSDAAVKGIAAVQLLGFTLQQPVELNPGEHKTISFSPDTYPRLRVQQPTIWWPYGMGKPHLENLKMRFSIGPSISDERSMRFGIREISSELTPTGARLFRVNGRPLLIRGGGWSQDMLLREQPEHLRQQFALVHDLNLNTIRLEGKLETDAFFDLADEQGVLVMAGWCCCDQWEHWAKWTPENYTVAAASLRSQMLRLRHHASVFVWLNGSDNAPPADVEKMYLQIESEMHWPNAILSAASTATTTTGANGVKMSGPYDFVAPSYWLVDKDRHGGAFGYNTETSPGPAIPTVYSLRKFLPPDKLWPENSTWDFHNGGEGFQKLSVFNEAMIATYGRPDSLEEYERLSQAMAYDGERAMFEAYGRNKYVSTGVVQWMLNNAWPSTIWHLYDYYLDAAGGYFGAKKACEPLHVQYSYDDHSVYVVNSTYQAAPGLHVEAHVYDLHLKEVYAQQSTLDAGADSSNKTVSIPDAVFRGGSSVYFVQLAMRDQAGEAVSQNFYWIPATLTTFDWAKTDYTHTPALSHENMLELRTLPEATIQAAVVPAREPEALSIRLSNPSTALALQVNLHAVDSQGNALEPAFWSDNYISLMPGEVRVVTLRLWQGARPNLAAVMVLGWNVKEMRVPIGAVAGRSQALSMR